MDESQKELKELDKLQAELRGIKVSELSEEEFTAYKEKAEKVHKLIDKIYNFN